MQIIDTVDLIKTYRESARKATGTEHCAVAIGKKRSESKSCYEILDYCSINELGGQAELNAISIPRKISYSLIKLCLKTGNIPIILHTHVPESSGDDYVSFSDVDREFIHCFYLAAVKSGYTSECLFIVTDGNTVMVCEKSQMAEEYTIL